MMQIKDVIKKVESFNYMISELELQSGLGKRYLLSAEFMTDGAMIERELNDIEKTKQFLSNPNLQITFDDVKRKLSQVKDVKGTMSRFSTGSVFDDIELFELKNLCLLCEEIRTLVSDSKVNIVDIPDITPALNILDPDKQRLPNFYIYDAYSKKLAEIRKIIKSERLKLEQIPQENIEEYNNQEDILDVLYYESSLEEDIIRVKLSEKLNEHEEIVSQALYSIARLDMLMAKASQAIKYNLVKPIISENKTEYKGIFNPQLKDILESQKKQYQPVEISLEKFPCLITGANMAGKTVLLKAIELAQYLFQFGFYIPAKEAQICIVEDILTCMEDGQESSRGLSSFAAEMLCVDNMVKSIKQGKNVLILIDELARTTNPMEGGAIVNGMIDFLGENKVQSIITTHYSGIKAKCKKLRVKGFIENKIHEPLTKDNIGNYIDYSLEEDKEEQVPKEAFRVASILGVDKELLDKIESYRLQVTSDKCL